jgi:hypothetical protein
MGKFKDIKEGDTVYIEETVRYGYHRGQSFFVPVKVIKTTKTQFTVEDGYRFMKENGKGIKDLCGNAYFLGDQVRYKEFVTDQSKECNALKEKLKVVSGLNTLISRVSNSSALTREVIESDVSIRMLMSLCGCLEDLLYAID